VKEYKWRNAMGEPRPWWERAWVNVARWMANHLPRLVVYFACIRLDDNARAFLQERGRDPGHGNVSTSEALSAWHAVSRDK